MANPILVASVLSATKKRIPERLSFHRRKRTILGITLLIFLLVLTLILVFTSKSNVVVVPIYISRKSWLPELVDRFNAENQASLSVRFECIESNEPSPIFDGAYRYFSCVLKANILALNSVDKCAY
jgi:Trk-type K+ transport system membrane component